MKILRLNSFSNRVYGVKDDGSVVVTESANLLCDLDVGKLDWIPVPADKLPVTLARWLEGEA